MRSIFRVARSSLDILQNDHTNNPFKTPENLPTIFFYTASADLPHLNNKPFPITLSSQLRSNINITCNKNENEFFIKIIIRAMIIKEVEYVSR